MKTRIYAAPAVRGLTRHNRVSPTLAQCTQKNLTLPPQTEGPHFYSVNKCKITSYYDCESTAYSADSMLVNRQSCRANIEQTRSQRPMLAGDWMDLGNPVEIDISGGHAIGVCASIVEMAVARHSPTRPADSTVVDFIVHPQVTTQQGEGGEEGRGEIDHRETGGEIDMATQACLQSITLSIIQQWVNVHTYTGLTFWPILTLPIPGYFCEKLQDFLLFFFMF